MLFINTNRRWYGIDQYCKTMTAGELIALLEQYDEDTPVYLRNDNGYTFGSIEESDIVFNYDLENVNN